MFDILYPFGNKGTKKISVYEFTNLFFKLVAILGIALFSFKCVLEEQFELQIKT